MSYVQSENDMKNELFSQRKQWIKIAAVSLGLWHNFGTNSSFENMVNILMRQGF